MIKAPNNPITLGNSPMINEPVSRTNSGVNESMGVVKEIGAVLIAFKYRMVEIELEIAM